MAVRTINGSEDQGAHDLDRDHCRAGRQPLEPGTAAHTARVVVAAVLAVGVIAVTVVAVAVVVAVFVITRSGADRTAGRSWDTCMSTKECVIWPRTMSLGWLSGLKGLVLVFGADDDPGRGRRLTMWPAMTACPSPPGLMVVVPVTLWEVYSVLAYVVES